AARAVQAVRALLCASQRFWNSVSIAKEEIGRVHERMVLLFRADGESPKHGFRKGIANGAALVCIVANRAIVEILMNQQHFWPAAVEADDARSPELAAVQSDVVRSDSCGKSALVEKLGVPLVDFQPQLPLLGIPVEVEIAGQFLHPRRLFCNCERLCRIRRGGCEGYSKTKERRQEKPAQMLQHF